MIREVCTTDETETADPMEEVHQQKPSEVVGSFTDSGGTALGSESSRNFAEASTEIPTVRQCELSRLRTSRNSNK